MPELLKLLTISETRAALGNVSRSYVYEEIAAGRLDARKVGRLTRVTFESVAELVKTLPKARVRPRKRAP
jgi:excisionase family DNA binding protein